LNFLILCRGFTRNGCPYTLLRLSHRVKCFASFFLWLLREDIRRTRPFLVPFLDWVPPPLFLSPGAFSPLLPPLEWPPQVHFLVRTPSFFLDTLTVAFPFFTRAVFPLFPPLFFSSPFFYLRRPGRPPPFAGLQCFPGGQTPFRASSVRTSPLFRTALPAAPLRFWGLFPVPLNYMPSSPALGRLPLSVKLRLSRLKPVSPTPELLFFAQWGWLFPFLPCTTLFFPFFDALRHFAWIAIF